MTTLTQSAWRAVHHPVAGAPRWAVVAATIVPFTVLPASVWRIVVVWFFPPEGGSGSGSDDLPAWLPIEVYVVILSVGSEALALTAFAMVARWGEVFPAWLPRMGGRRIPVSLAGVPALLAAAVLTLVTLAGLVSNLNGRTIRDEPLPDNYPLHFRDAEGVVSVLCYAPLLLWGPLLGALALAYWSRRLGSGRTNPDS
jgi:hypothetical protein